MRKNQPHVFERFEAGEEVSGSEMIAATGYHLVVGLVVAFVQWAGCIIAIIAAFAIGGLVLGIPVLIVVLWWAGRQAIRGLKQL